MMSTMPQKKLASSLLTTTNNTNSIRDNSASARAPEKGKAKNRNSLITLPRRSLAVTKIHPKSVQRHKATMKRAVTLKKLLWS